MLRLRMIERNCIEPNVLFKALYTSHHNENKKSERGWKKALPAIFPTDALAYEKCLTSYKQTRDRGGKKICKEKINNLTFARKSQCEVIAAAREQYINETAHICTHTAEPELYHKCQPSSNPIDRSV